MSQAVIFDLDGTLVDTQVSLHAKSELVALAKLGVHITPEDISQRFAGYPTAEVFRTLLTEHQIEYNDQLIQDLLTEKWNVVRELIPSLNFADLQLLAPWVKTLSQLNFPLAIASASPAWYIDEVCQRTVVDDVSLADLVSVRVSAESVTRPKPFPDVFLSAANQINISPHLCTAVGDGHSDVFAGLAAGMSVIFCSREPVPDITHAQMHRLKHLPNLKNILSADPYAVLRFP